MSSGKTPRTTTASPERSQRSPGKQSSNKEETGKRTNNGGDSEYVEHEVQEYYYPNGKKNDKNLDEMNRLLRNKQTNEDTYGKHTAYTNMSLLENILGVKKKTTVTQTKKEKEKKKKQKSKPQSIPADNKQRQVQEKEGNKKRKTDVPKKQMLEDTPEEKEKKKQVVIDQSGDETTGNQPAVENLSSGNPPDGQEGTKSNMHPIVKDTNEDETHDGPVDERKSQAVSEKERVDPTKPRKFLSDALVHTDEEQLVLKTAEQFVHVFNDQKVQDSIQGKIDAANERIREVCCKALAGEYKDVFDILQGIREIVDSMKSIENAWKIYELVCSSDLLGLLKDEHFQFFQDESKELDDRVDTFIQLVDEHTQGNNDNVDLDEDFELYLTKWKENRRAWVSEVDLKKQENQMREEYQRKKDENSKSLDSKTTKLFPIEQAADKESTKGLQQFLNACFESKKTDDELKDFIKDHNIGTKYDQILQQMKYWSVSSETNFICSAKGIKINESLFMKEIQRLFMFMPAVLLNSSQSTNGHAKFLQEMIEEAGEEEPDRNSLVIPWIAYGQLPPPIESRTRSIEVQFVFTSSVSTSALDMAKAEINNKFHVETAFTETKANILNAKISPKGNLPSTISGALSMLTNMNVRAILVGDFGMTGFRHAMNPEFNMIYSVNGRDREPGFKPNYFVKPYNRGGEPYYCPNGWRRFAVDVGMNGDEFEKAYKDWHVAYHGTDIQNAHAILSSGLRAHKDPFFIKPGEAAVYISPSIEYSGFPYYAKLRKINGKYIQMVLMLRVRPTLVFEKHHGTIGGAYPHDDQMDPNFSNKELEWVIKWPPGGMMSTTDGILVYGLMFRVTDEHPENLPQNKWWAKGKGEYPKFF